MHVVERTVWLDPPVSAASYTEGQDPPARRVYAVGLVLETPTRNGTWYDRAIVEQGHHGMSLPALGMDGHPRDAGQAERFQDASVLWQERHIRRGPVLGEEKEYVELQGQLLTESPAGRAVQEALEAGAPVGVSLRGWATRSETREIDGVSVRVPHDLVITTYDLVPNPSSVGSRATQESLFCLESVQIKEQVEMTEEPKSPETAGVNPALTADQIKSLIAEALQAHRPAPAEAPDPGASLDEIKQLQEKLENQQAQQLREYRKDEIVKRELENWSAQFPQDFREKAERDMRDKTELLLQRDPNLSPEEVWAKAVEEVTPDIGKLAAMHDLKQLAQRTEEMGAAMREGRAMPDTPVPQTTQRKGAGPVTESHLMTEHEKHTGLPEYTRYCYAMLESFVQDQHFRHEIRSKLNGKVHTELDWSPAAMRQHPNMSYAAEVLEHHDRIHQDKLLYEYQQLHTQLHKTSHQKMSFWEAVLSSDVATPTTTDRAIIMAALPMLVSTSVFDFGTVAGSEVKVPDEYRETFYSQALTTGATALTGSADAGDMLQLSHQNLDPDTAVTVGSLTQGTDFVVDFRNGVIHILVDGVTLGNAGYSYRAYAGNENAAIPQSEWKTRLHTINIVFTRLQTEISREAIAFARADTGWDARTRNLFGLAFEIQEKIDRDNWALAKTAALVAGHSATVGGAANINLNTDAGLKQSRTAISYAKSLIEDDFYMANAIIGSVRSIELLADWEGFQRDGFPDGTLMANGMVTMHKGCRVIKTTLMADDHLLVTSPMSVRYRSLQGEMLQTTGPDRSVDTTTGRPKDVESWIVSCGDWAGFHRPERTAMVPLATS